MCRKSFFFNSYFIQDNEVWNLIVPYFIGILLNMILENVFIIIYQSS